MTIEASQPRPRGVMSSMTILLGACVTVVVWMGVEAIRPFTSDASLIVSGYAAVSLWLLTLAYARNRFLARHAAWKLGVLKHHAEFNSGIDDSSAPRCPGIGYAPGMLVLLLGVGFVVSLRTIDLTVVLAMYGDSPAYQYGLLGAVTAITWLLVLGGDRARFVSRRLRLECQAVDHVARALDALTILPVPTSLCGPDGRRSRFNPAYVELVGKPVSQLEGLGWLNSLHAPDREAIERLFEGVAGKSAIPLDFEYGMTNADGANKWVREHLVPRFDDAGTFVAYLVTGIDITSQIENETELNRKVTRLEQDVDESRAAHKADNRQSTEQIEELTIERDGLQREVDAARKETSKVEDNLRKAKADVAQARAELKSAEADVKERAVERRTLDQSLAKLQKVVEQMEADDKVLRDELERAKKQIERSQVAADEQRRSESQLRTKVKSLTERCQELEAQLAQTETAEAEAREASEAQQRAMATEVAERSQALARELRPQMDLIDRLAERLQGAVDEDHLNDLESLKASLSSLEAVLDDVLGAETTDHPAGASERMFDLRAAFRSVCDLIPLGEKEREERLRCVVHPEFPPLAHGDPVRIREALLHMTRRALEVTEEGAVTMKLSPDGTTPTHVAARFEVRHETKRIDGAALSTAFGMDESPGEAVGVAARTWQIVSSMDGEFGREIPAEGGFVVWFTLTLAKPQGRPSDHGAMPMPSAAPMTFAPVEPAPVEARPKAVPRLPQEFLECNLGSVIELGSETAKVRSTKNLKGTVTFTLGKDCGNLEVEAEVESSERQGIRHFEVLIRFVGLTPGLGKALHEVAMTHRTRSMLPINSVE